MKYVKKITFVFVLAVSSLSAQTFFDHDYYASNLNSFSFFNPDLAKLTQSPTEWQDQQLHFRWNGYLYFGDDISSQVSVRSRLFSGHQWKENPNGFRELLTNDGLAFNSVSKDGVGVNHQIDRLYIQWEKKDWNVRLGRQRINWGIQNYWNPHDLFNQTNFFDFDYIENPGTDAIRITYYPQANQSVEVAIDKNIIASLYKINRFDYDFQFLTAKYFREFCLGFGWAGQLKNMGFKGEFSYFQDDKKREINEFIGSISLDYNFRNGVYLSWTCLYKNNTLPFNPLELYQMETSAKNPIPFEYNFMYQAQYNVFPLVQVGGALIHDKNLDFVFINPQITFSIYESIDFMVSSQNNWSRISNETKETQQTIFTRLQWNF